MSLKMSLSSLLSKAESMLPSGNPLMNDTGLVAGSLAGGTIIGGTAVALSRRKKHAKHRSTHRRKRTPHHHRRHVRLQHHRRRHVTHHKVRKKHGTHARRTHRSGKHGRLHYTRKGQPYIILSNGRARFVKGHRRK